MQKRIKFRSEILLGAAIIASYFFLRLIYINRLPIFTDEAIYMRWAQIALHDASWRFISLTDGKQPMFIWFSMVFMKFIKDPLIAGRLVSVTSGFFTMLGIFALSYEMFKNKTTSFLAAILYVFYPMAQVYDRMAIMDGMVGTFFVWALYFSVLLVRKARLNVAYTLGFLIGGGTLTKSTNFFSIYLLPFTLILFDFTKKGLPARFIRWASYALFSVVIGYGLYSILRLSPLFGMITEKNDVFIYPLSQWIHHPFTYFFSNFSGLFSWLVQYLKIPYIVLILVALILIKKSFKEKLLLFLYFVLPFTALALFGKLIYPRFIYFMSLSLLPLAAWGLNYVIGEALKYVRGKDRVNLTRITVPIIVAVFVWYPLFVSFQFAQDPINSQIANADNSQYANSWAAGWGVSQSIAFFKEQAQTHKIYVATEGTFGLMPESMEMYLLEDKNITVKGYWPLDSFPKQVEDAARSMPTYFIFYQPQHRILPSSFPLKLLFKVRQGNTNYFYRVYQVVPQQK